MLGHILPLPLLYNKMDLRGLLLPAMLPPVPILITSEKDTAL